MLSPRSNPTGPLRRTLVPAASVGHRQGHSRAQYDPGRGRRWEQSQPQKEPTILGAVFIARRGLGDQARPVWTQSGGGGRGGDTPSLQEPGGLTARVTGSRQGGANTLQGPSRLAGLVVRKGVEGFCHAGLE